MNEQRDQKRILIFEDDVDLASQWADALRDRGYHSEISDSRVGAEELCRAMRFDAAIVDVFIRNRSGRPVGDGGLTLINHLRIPLLANTPDWGATIPIVVVSGAAPNGVSNSLAHALDFGANAVATKPIDPNDLIDMVEALLAEQSSDGER